MTDMIVMQTAVGVSDATDDQREMYEEMARLFESRYQLFVNKNLDYNSSFVTAGRVEQELDSGGGPFDTALESNIYKLFTRLQDKQQRLYSLVFDGGESRIDESAAETAGDAAVYWFMIHWLLSDGDAE